MIKAIVTYKNQDNEVFGSGDTVKLTLHDKCYYLRNAVIDSNLLIGELSNLGYDCFVITTTNEEQESKSYIIQTIEVLSIEHIS